MKEPVFKSSIPLDEIEANFKGVSLFEQIYTALKEAIAYERGKDINGIVVSERTNNMGYRRLFIMRKDLHMSAGKLAAQVGHCAEAYWLRLIRKSLTDQGESERVVNHVAVGYFLPNEMVDEYINSAIVKTICEAKSKTHLLKAKSQAEELGLVEGHDFGLIYDKCLTELEPEEDDGTTLTGIWFKPLPDATAHQISRKYHLYM